MNSKDLGELASDQKIKNVFRAFGYSIPVGKDGRRLWPTKFKNAIGQRMRSGELSVGAVQRTCKVSDKTAYKWRKDDFRKKSKSLQNTDQTTPAFAEIKVREDNTAAQHQSSPIIFRRAGCELILPGSYSITDIVRLIQAFENQS